MSRDFGLGRKLRCDIPVWLAGGVNCQPRTGLIFSDSTHCVRDDCFRYILYWVVILYWCCVLAGEPSASGLQENDYPVLSDDRIGLVALKEIGSVKRLPLPAELAERFACILYLQFFVVVAAAAAAAVGQMKVVWTC